MKYLLLWLCTLPLSGILAQQADHYIISPQGDFSQGRTMSVSWTIGDLVTETARLDNELITQGFQQPILSVYEISPSDQVATATLASDKEKQSGLKMESDSQSSDFNARVFPNPFSTDLTIEIDNKLQEYSLDIFNSQGHLIDRLKSTNQREVLNLIHLPAAQYILRITSADLQHSKSFQITKSR